jgi:vacuolar-type H+-ATPase subunit E/Vma4
MNELEAKQCYESMLKFIHKQGQDKADQIQAQTKEEFKKERENFIAAE